MTSANFPQILPPRVGLPLAMQMIALLVCTLIGAQLVTLALTMLLPPRAVSRWDMAEVVAALSNEAVSSRLERRTLSGPPDITSEGWLVSESSTRILAQRLHRSTQDVVLAFYTQLPVGGVAVPARSGSTLAGTRISKVESPSMLIGSMLVPTAQAQSIPGGPPPGGIPAGGMPGGRFPGGMVPGGSMPRVPSGSGMPTHMPSPGGIRAPTMPATPSTPHAGTIPAANPGMRPGSGSVTQPGGRPSGTPPAMNPGGSGAPSDLPASAATRNPIAAGPGPTPQMMPAQGVHMAGGAVPVVNTIPVARVPGGIATASIREEETAQQTSTATLPVLSRPAAIATARVTAPAVPVRSVKEAEAKAPSRTAQSVTANEHPVPFMRTRENIFQSASPPFIEGDFIAAVRQSNGTWLAVAPAAEPFPNAWQARVMLWFLLSLAVVSPLAWLLARRIVIPLRNFARAAEQLGRDPSATIMPLSGPAEIGRAAYAFNQMRNRLRAFVDDRTAMVGAISHDLRTPLTRLRFRIEDAPDDQRENLLREVTEMEAMISQVISFIRDASTPGPRERMDFAELVRGSVADARLVGGDVEIEHNLTIPVEVDPVGIRRLLGNLLENAVKYGDRARVRVSLQDGEAVADIIDGGPGIPEEEFDRAFEPFYRSETARKSGRTGSGLGLAVCRSIARAHGGDVCFTHANDGFVARVTVPAAFDSTLRRAA